MMYVFSALIGFVIGAGIAFTIMYKLAKWERDLK